MKVLRVELEEFDPGNVPALVPIDDLTVIIGSNGVGKSIVLESIERMLRFEPELERRGRGEDPVNPYGWVHARLDVSQNPGSDWAWFRKLLAQGIPGEEASDIPGDLAEILGGPEHFESQDDYEKSLTGPHGGGGSVLEPIPLEGVQSLFNALGPWPRDLGIRFDGGGRNRCRYPVVSR